MGWEREGQELRGAMGNAWGFVLEDAHPIHGCMDIHARRGFCGVHGRSSRPETETKYSRQSVHEGFHTDLQKVKQEGPCRNKEPV